MKIRTFHTLRILSQEYDIAAVCFIRDKDVLEDPQLLRRRRESLSTYCELETFALPQARSRARFYWDHLRSLSTGHVYTRYMYESSRALQRIEELYEQGGCELVHLDTLDLSQVLNLLDPNRTVCVHHNIESELLRSRSTFVNSSLKGWYLRHQARLMREEEVRWSERVRMNIVVSDDDRRSLTEMAPRAHVEVIPNGVDVDYFRPSPGTPVHGMLFVGGTTWFPNLDALHFFREDLLPRLRSRGVEEPVTWVGRATEEEIRAYSSDAFRMTGYVADIRPYLSKARCYVVPLRVGGGTRLKILDAWAAGKAVVSTTAGCRGLDAREGENILIRDDPDDFAEAVRMVMTDAEVRSHLEEGARSTVETEYSWQVLGNRMLSLYDKMLREPR